MQTSLEKLKFHSVSNNCGYDELIEYPSNIAVSMSAEVWGEMIASLNNILFFNASIEIRDAEDIDFIAMDDAGGEVDLYEYDDPLEFSCWKLHKPYEKEPILFLVLQAKYHDTLITYELTKS